ncbi:MAG: DUF1156 domain-containing protein, partial [Bradymonadaceae bacterium]
MTIFRFGIDEDSTSVVLEDPRLRQDELGLQESTIPPDTTSYRLIEKFFPSEAVGEGSHKERYSQGKTPHTIFTWWARRPFAAVSGMVTSSLIRGDGQMKAACDLVEEHCLQSGVEGGKPITRAAMRALIGEERQRVLDVFAGGGTIPLEAASAGVRAYALENNELAHFIQHALLRMTQGDESLPELIEACGAHFLDALEAETASFYPYRELEDGSKT